MHRQILFCGAIIAMGSIHTSAVSQGTPAISTVDLTTLDCRTLLQMEGDNRDDTVLFLHGYVSGQARQTKIELAPISEATDRIVNECIDKPSDNLLAVFMRNRR